jgi:hypothetical protein
MVWRPGSGKMAARGLRGWPSQTLPLCYDRELSDDWAARFLLCLLLPFSSGGCTAEYLGLRWPWCSREGTHAPSHSNAVTAARWLGLRALCAIFQFRSRELNPPKRPRSPLWRNDVMGTDVAEPDRTNVAAGARDPHSTSARIGSSRVLERPLTSGRRLRVMPLPRPPVTPAILDRRRFEMSSEIFN